jgi:hypothetical protein
MRTEKGNNSYTGYNCYLCALCDLVSARRGTLRMSWPESPLGGVGAGPRRLPMAEPEDREKSEAYQIQQGNGNSAREQYIPFPRDRREVSESQTYRSCKREKGRGNEKGVPNKPPVCHAMPPIPFSRQMPSYPKQPEPSVRQPKFSDISDIRGTVGSRDTTHFPPFSQWGLPAIYQPWAVVSQAFPTSLPTRGRA